VSERGLPRRTPLAAGLALAAVAKGARALAAVLVVLGLLFVLVADANLTRKPALGATAATHSTAPQGPAVAGTDGEGANLSRFIARARAGRPVKIVAIGDSILQGTTVAADGGTLGVDDTLSVVRDAVAARFAVTATAVNHALSGHTVATGPLSRKWTAAVNEDADLYLVNYGNNDLSGDLTAAPVPGYPLAASMAGLERLFRRLRSDVPKADIAFLIANPYAGGTDAGKNPAKRAYNRRVADVCAAYGVELIDGYAPFIARGDYSSLMADGAHPNSAGHRLLADTIMKHLPAASSSPARPPALVPARGLASPQNVDTTVGDTGTLSYLVPTAPMWTEAGTWVDEGRFRVATSAGARIRGRANFTELYALIDTSAANSLHATLTVDGADVFTSQDMTTGKQGGYWVPLVTGLAPGTHTYEFILTGGTMKVDRVGWLVGADAVG
jgi:lysophospholipase L1-like esterase